MAEAKNIFSNLENPSKHICARGGGKVDRMVPADIVASLVFRNDFERSENRGKGKNQYNSAILGRAGLALAWGAKGPGPGRLGSS